MAHRLKIKLLPAVFAIAIGLLSFPGSSLAATRIHNNFGETRGHQNLIINLHENDPIMFYTIEWQRMCDGQYDICLAYSMPLIGIGFSQVTIINADEQQSKIVINNRKMSLFPQEGQKVVMVVNDKFYTQLFRILKQHREEVSLVLDRSSGYLFYEWNQQKASDKCLTWQIR